MPAGVRVSAEAVSRRCPAGKRKWKKTCCLPSFVIFLFVLGCVVAGVTLLAVFRVDAKHLTVNAVLIAIAAVVGLALLLNCRTWWQVLDSLLNSQRKRLHSAASRLHKLKSEGFMKVRQAVGDGRGRGDGRVRPGLASGRGARSWASAAWLRLPPRFPRGGPGDAGKVVRRGFVTRNHRSGRTGAFTVTLLVGRASACGPAAGLAERGLGTCPVRSRRVGH